MAAQTNRDPRFFARPPPGSGIVPR